MYVVTESLIATLGMLGGVYTAQHIKKKSKDEPKMKKAGERFLIFFIVGLWVFIVPYVIDRVVFLLKVVF